MEEDDTSYKGYLKGLSIYVKCHILRNSLLDDPWHIFKDYVNHHYINFPVHFLETTLILKSFLYSIQMKLVSVLIS